MLYDNLSSRTILITLGILILTSIICLSLVYIDLNKLKHVKNDRKNDLETAITFELFFIIIAIIYDLLVLLFGDAFFNISIFTYLLLSIFISIIIITLRFKS